jgi:hypothetical protein
MVKPELLVAATLVAGTAGLPDQSPLGRVASLTSSSVLNWAASVILFSFLELMRWLIDYGVVTVP